MIFCHKESAIFIKRKSYIQSIVDTVKVFGFLYWSRKYLIPQAIFYLYKSQSDKEWSILAISRLELSNLNSPALKEFKRDELFSTFNSFTTEKKNTKKNIASLSLH